MSELAKLQRAGNSVVGHDALAMSAAGIGTRLKGISMRKSLDRLYLWTGYAAGGCLVLIFALMMALAIGREFGLNIPSGDDYASWAMAALSFLGLAHTFRRGEMIRVGLLLERLSGRTKHAFELFALAASLVFLGYFCWYACGMTYDSWRFNDMSTGVVSVPLWIPQLGMALGLVILVIAFVDEFVHVARGNRPSFEKPPPKNVDELLERIVEGGGV